MIGNDIVDISELSKSKHWNTQRYLDKIFTPSEQQLIANSNNKLRMISRLWSMKESAYKIISKRDEIKFHNPKLLICDISYENLGSVRFNNEKIFTSTLEHQNYTLSSAYFEEILSSKLITKTEEYTTDSSPHASLINAIQQHVEAPIRIKKNDNNIPYISDDQNFIYDRFSISHHGGYWSYVYLNDIRK